MLANTWIEDNPDKPRRENQNTMRYVVRYLRCCQMGGRNKSRIGSVFLISLFFTLLQSQSSCALGDWEFSVMYPPPIPIRLYSYVCAHSLNRAEGKWEESGICSFCSAFIICVLPGFLQQQFPLFHSYDTQSDHECLSPKPGGWGKEEDSPLYLAGELFEWTRNMHVQGVSI